LTTSIQKIKKNSILKILDNKFVADPAQPPTLKDTNAAVRHPAHFMIWLRENNKKWKIRWNVLLTV